MEFLVGRQAMLDRNCHTFGYELLYRENIKNNTSFSALDGNTATNRVIINTFLNLGIDRIAKNGRVFINFTRDLIVQRLYETLPKEKVVVEILEDVAAEDEVVEAIKDAKKQGYMIALDDFVFMEHLEKLVALADIIKIDFLELSRDEIKKQVEIYKNYNLKLLAEKVEDEETFKFALDLGFSYFQGYFFQKPVIEAKTDIAPYQMNILKAMAIINNPESEPEELIKIISGDIYLHTKILAFVNSPFFGLKHKINTIKAAVGILGLKRVKEWLNIMYVSKLSEKKPEELIILSSVRAKLASFLAEHFSVDEDDAYLLGMFSLMDSILNLPMEIVLKEFDYLSEDLKAALTGKENNCKKLLDFIKMFEVGDFDRAYEIVKDTSLDIEQVNDYYFKSIEFADSIYSA